MYNVPSYDIGLQVERCAQLYLSKVGMLFCIRNQGKRKAGLQTLDHRQTDTIDCNKTLRDDKGTQMFREFDLNSVCNPLSLDGEHTGRCLNMALHQVSAYASIRQKSAFQVDMRTWLQPSPARATNGLNPHTNAQPLLPSPGYPQQPSINADTFLRLVP